MCTANKWCKNNDKNKMKPMGGKNTSEIALKIYKHTRNFLGKGIEIREILPEIVTNAIS